MPHTNLRVKGLPAFTVMIILPTAGLTLYQNTYVQFVCFFTFAISCCPRR